MAQIKSEEIQRAANRALGHAQHMPLAAPASDFVQSAGGIAVNEARGTAVHFGISHPFLLGRLVLYPPIHLMSDSSSVGAVLGLENHIPNRGNSAASQVTPPRSDGFGHTEIQGQRHCKHKGGCGLQVPVP